MKSFIRKEQSIKYAFEGNEVDIIRTIANKYIGNNPPIPFEYMLWNKDGFKSNKEGDYVLDFAQKYPKAHNGQIAYGVASHWSHQEGDFTFKLKCNGPITMCVNGEQVFKSNNEDETQENYYRKICVSLNPGWNVIALKCTKSIIGFGCTFGSISPKWAPINLHTPFKEREGHSGWIFSELLDKENESIQYRVHHDMNEKEMGIRWYPTNEWNETQKNVIPCRRIFQEEKVGYILAWSKINNVNLNKKDYILKVKTYSAIEMYINGVSYFKEEQAGEYNINVCLAYGDHDILIKSEIRDNEEWGYEIESSEENLFVLPYPVKGQISPWLYVGPLIEENLLEPITSIQSVERVFEGIEGQTYWRADLPTTYIRPFVKSELFGRWTYPLGVTLYGLIQAGRVLKDESIINYVIRHVEGCTKMYAYSKWDKDQYGYPGINHQLLFLDALDDCGSFGSLMLEVLGESEGKAVEDIAHLIGKYMIEEQERLEDGTFFRGHTDDGTMWADDLYMSVPFLCRYHQLTQDRKYLDEAIAQILKFKNYLFMEEENIMSHVYSGRYKTMTGIPWGRGNGWVFFSISELLGTLPEGYKGKEEVLKFYNQLLKGYLNLQGENGLWHQVLNCKEAYEETSCTSMFLYGMARGVRYGWIQGDEISRVIEAVYKAWEGIIEKSVDRYGNVYGICKGSSFSFTKEYYMYELLTNLNDTHGIGIVLLAGIELEKLKQFLREMN